MPCFLFEYCYNLKNHSISTGKTFAEE